MTSSADSTQQIRKVKASAGINFLSKISLDASAQQSTNQTDIDQFITKRTNSLIVTIGGPSFTQNLTLEEWQRGVVDKPVTIDRTGVPLYQAITPAKLPNMLYHTRNAVEEYLRAAIMQYYDINTRRGCTDPAANNFDFAANLDDNTCEQMTNNFTFGGIYQRCSTSSSSRENLCTSGQQPVEQVNPLTGDFTCPPGYTAVSLHNGSITHTVQGTACHEECESCGFLWLSDCCECRTVQRDYHSTAYYKTYWCAVLTDSPHVSRNEGYLFGGYYPCD